ncbi:hypothetical protein EVAR_550_1 [Eumeta japonica]|uniref:Uncharacterized protein n=1 Tax=Eumeta variegata TaxID=151549 RepID=A0A4C1SDW2_EUMVA|nr:hypothetical protein EVAR_550_1 [Eumeta japonica]
MQEGPFEGKASDPSDVFAKYFARISISSRCSTNLLTIDFVSFNQLYSINICVGICSRRPTFTNRQRGDLVHACVVCEVTELEIHTYVMQFLCQMLIEVSGNFLADLSHSENHEVNVFLA